MYYINKFNRLKKIKCSLFDISTASITGPILARFKGYSLGYIFKTVLLGYNSPQSSMVSGLCLAAPAKVYQKAVVPVTPKLTILGCGGTALDYRWGRATITQLTRPRS